MKRLPYLVLGLVAVGYISYVWHTRTLLPERVATHFNMQGVPDGWMSRGGLVAFMLGLGIGVPLFIAGALSLVRVAPARFINIPHREHWLGPERRTETAAWISRGGVWLASMIMAFMGFMHHLVIKANELPSPRIDNGSVLLGAGVMVVVAIVFVVRLLMRFSKTPAEPA